MRQRFVGNREDELEEMEFDIRPILMQQVSGYQG